MIVVSLNSSCIPELSDSVASGCDTNCGDDCSCGCVSYEGDGN